MSEFVLDFETVDPLISEGYGSGWAYELNYKLGKLKILGAACYGNGYDEYITDREHFKEVILSQDNIIAHNIAYDWGVLQVLFEGDDRFKPDQYTLYDTLVMTKMSDQNHMSYSLDSLSKAYGGPRKDTKLLLDYVYNSGLYGAHKLETTGRKTHVRPSDSLLSEYAYTHMDLIPVATVAEYALADAHATMHLYHTIKNKLGDYDVRLYSDLYKLCSDLRKRGHRIDLDKAKTNHAYCLEKAAQYEQELYNLAGKEFNVDSPKQLGDIFLARGLDPEKLKDENSAWTGNYSTGKAWLETQSDDFCRTLLKYRKYNKVANDFLGKIIGACGIDPTTGPYGRVHLNLYPHGATQTGRFTSGAYSKRGTSFELNIQQIPGRDEELGVMCREVFIPEKWEKQVTADFSNQEQRIQVHYGVVLGCTGARAVAAAWADDPHLDYHGKIAEMVGLDRTLAKTINLGLSYGMGQYKLADSIGKSVEATEGILRQYHRMLPFMKQLQQITRGSIKKNGYIKTLGGTKLKLKILQTKDGRTIVFDKDGLSKLIQGSAADQTRAAMVECYRRGLKVLFSVHDEISITSADPNRDAPILQNIMENVYKLEVPMLAEPKIGDCWSETK